VLLLDCLDDGNQIFRIGFASQMRSQDGSVLGPEFLVGIVVYGMQDL